MKLSKQEMQRDRFGFATFLSISLHSIILIGIGLEFPPQKVGEPITKSLPKINLNQQFPLSHEIRNRTAKNSQVQIKSLPSTNKARPILELMIEDLQIRIENRRKNNRQRPQRRTISTVSAQKEQAIYLETWRKRIEEVGNQYYPEEARKNRIFGNLRILVAVRADGQIEDVRILETSGSKVLDDAAERIVLLAAPFDPLPEEISVETDILEIIRTWRFHERTSLETM